MTTETPKEEQPEKAEDTPVELEDEAVEEAAGAGPTGGGRIIHQF